MPCQSLGEGRCRDYLAREYFSLAKTNETEAPHIPLIRQLAEKDDDLVHPFKQLEDKCKRLVVGSNPTAGAKLSAHRGRFNFANGGASELLHSR